MVQVLYEHYSISTFDELWEAGVVVFILHVRETEVKYATCDRSAPMWKDLDLSAHWPGSEAPILPTASHELRKCTYFLAYVVSKLVFYLQG